MKMKLPNNVMASPDEVCEFCADKGIKVTIRRMPEDPEYFLIEGDTEALEFLGQLLIAQARFEMDRAFQISPNGAGSALFGKESDTGIYIHRLPCLE